MPIQQVIIVYFFWYHEIIGGYKIGMRRLWSEDFHLQYSNNADKTYPLPLLRRTNSKMTVFPSLMTGLLAKFIRAWKPTAARCSWIVSFISFITIFCLVMTSANSAIIFLWWSMSATKDLNLAPVSALRRGRTNRTEATLINRDMLYSSAPLLHKNDRPQSTMPKTLPVPSTGLKVWQYFFLNESHRVLMLLQNRLSWNYIGNEWITSASVTPNQ